MKQKRAGLSLLFVAILGLLLSVRPQRVRDMRVVDFIQIYASGAVLGVAIAAIVASRGRTAP